MSINVIWTKLDFFTDIDAAFLWLDMEPDENKFPRSVREAHYELNTNVFSLIMIKYSVDGTKVIASDVTYTPIEFLDWECLTVGALGWGQIQIANSNNIILNNGYSRKKWMIQLCETMLDFYPKEILKIQDRIVRFENVKEHWESREDIWV